MSRRNQVRIRNILKEDALKASEVVDRIPGKHVPTAREVAGWLRTVCCPRTPRRGGSNESVWGPLD